MQKERMEVKRQSTGNSRKDRPDGRAEVGVVSLRACLTQINPKLGS
jgi:hypothetical protein